MAYRPTKLLTVLFSFGLVVSACASIDQDAETTSELFHPDNFEGPTKDPVDFDPIKVGEPLPDGYRESFNRDAIAPIYNPTFVQSDRINWPDEELVIGVEIDGDARAYPVGFLNRREIINDIHNGVPTLVSWCPLCGTGMVHKRVFNNKEIVFGNQGDLFNEAMTLFDHETGSIWSQPFGEAIMGPRTGDTIELLPSSLTTWGDWLDNFPDSLALNSPSTPAGVSLNDLMIVVELNEEVVAFPTALLAEEIVINTKVGGVPILITREEGTDNWVVLSRLLGKDPVELDVQGGQLKEVAGSRSWDQITGVNTKPGEPNLRILPAFTQFPKDFPVFFPDGSIWRNDESNPAS